MHNAAVDEVEDVPWGLLISDEQWSVYSRIIQAAAGKCIPIALGGGLAFSHYSNRWRQSG